MLNNKTNVHIDIVVLLNSLKKSDPLIKLTTHKVRKQNSLPDPGMFAWAPVIARNNDLQKR
jgi:hypothetical protein